MEFYKKYRHVGASHPSVPGPWKPIVEKAIIAIEKEIWPSWMPLFIKRWIHYLASGNSVVRIKYWWAYSLEKRYTGGQSIVQIKDKFAGLCIYMSYYSEKTHNIIRQAEKDCSKICEKCGSTDGVEIVGKRWYYNYCIKCAEELKNVKNNLLYF